MTTNNRMIDGGAGHSATGAAKLRTKSCEVTSWLPGGSDSLVFRLTCEHPAAATACAGSA